MDVVMVRYGELFLKSEPVKRQFIRHLQRNIARALESEGLAHRFEFHRGRILIHGDDPLRIAAVTGTIFGIVEVAVCTFTESTLPAVSSTAVERAGSFLAGGGSFAIRARRQGVEGITSQEIGARVGEAVLEAFPGATVNLSRPQFEIFVEMREFGALVYDSPITAPGGLPWGTQGRALALLSGGVDSPVATWLMMKRGCEMSSLHIDAGNYTGADTLSRTLASHATLSTWCRGYPMDLMVADARPFFEALVSRPPARFRCVLCKRFMLALGSRIVRDHRFSALITGDSLGQVASQTLPNLATISEAATVPLIRPLIAFDKNETVAIAKKIGVFTPEPSDLACRAVPRMPATAARVQDIREAEKQLGTDELLENVLGQVTVKTALNGKIQ
ncbi:MAG TPA: tRNA sulfurtransferase [Methanoregulaceae archaeon]|nr:MAG: tRNA sulfurtransferase [Methanolinea sp.]HPD09997.1 tRNA sulfurtransferase [Methanoregulaceae archaeon]